jgi:phage FluMu protein Com
VDPTSERSGCCDGDQLRCGCGSLLARLVEGGVELKCRRCKRVIVVPLTEEGGPRAASSAGGR